MITRIREPKSRQQGVIANAGMQPSQAQNEEPRASQSIMPPVPTSAARTRQEIEPENIPSLR